MSHPSFISLYTKSSDTKKSNRLEHDVATTRVVTHRRCSRVFESRGSLSTANLQYDWLASRYAILVCFSHLFSTGDYQQDDGHILDTPQVFSYLSRVMYNRRNKFDPLWNSLVVAGCDGGKPFLGQVGGISMKLTM